MRAPKRKVVLLGEDKDGQKRGRTDSSMILTMNAFLYTDSTDPGKKRRRRRRKRSSSTDKAIELAVFVDDDLYRKEKKAAGDNDPIAAIQDLVFTYLNSVSRRNLRIVRVIPLVGEEDETFPTLRCNSCTIPTSYPLSSASSLSAWRSSACPSAQWTRLAATSRSTSTPSAGGRRRKSKVRTVRSDLSRCFSP